MVVHVDVDVKIDAIAKLQVEFEAGIEVGNRSMSRVQRIKGRVDHKTFYSLVSTFPVVLGYGIL